MSLQLNVPSIRCSGCANSVTQSITAIDPTATVYVDIETKLVTIDTQASETSVKEAIAAVGHKVA